MHLYREAVPAPCNRWSSRVGSDTVKLRVIENTTGKPALWFLVSAMQNLSSAPSFSIMTTVNAKSHLSSVDLIKHRRVLTVSDTVIIFSCGMYLRDAIVIATVALGGGRSRTMLRTVAALRQALDAPPHLSVPDAIKLMSEVMVCSVGPSSLVFYSPSSLLPRFLFS